MKRIYHWWLGKALFAGASAVIATSELEIQDLIAAGVASEKIVFRRNGVEAPTSWPAPSKFRTAQGIPEHAKLILFLGRLSLKKSPEILLQAFAQLPEQVGEKPLLLAFAGPDGGGQQQRLALEAARLGVSSRVKFTGAVYGEEKWAAYRDADVFVLPSQNENFGNTAAEAMAAGTPVIVTENCGIAPLLKDTAGLVVSHDGAAVANAMKKLLDDGQFYSRLVQGCAELTARLDWGQPVTEMETLYARLTTIEGPGNSTRSPE